MPPAAPRPARGRLRSLLTAAATTALTMILACGLLATPASADGSEPSTAPGDRAISGYGSGDGSSADFSGPATSANARFIVASYQELVGRPADTAGLDFHLARMAGGGGVARLGFSYALLFSPEGARNEVVAAYDEILGRVPDEAGASYWTNHLQGHSVTDLRVLLLASDEHVTRAGGSDQAWLSSLYQDLLGRGVDAPGLGYWLAQRDAGVSRILIAAAIHYSDEALWRRAILHYEDTLGRPPSRDEAGGVVATLLAHGERMAKARLWASDEAFEPFLQAAWS